MSSFTSPFGITVGLTQKWNSSWFISSSLPHPKGSFQNSLEHVLVEDFFYQAFYSSYARPRLYIIPRKSTQIFGSTPRFWFSTGSSSQFNRWRRRFQQSPILNRKVVQQKRTPLSQSTILPINLYIFKNTAGTYTGLIFFVRQECVRRFRSKWF